MKVGIIRCMQTEDFCPGTADFRALRERTGAFAGAEEIEIVGFANCGGCPGKKAVLRAREFVRRGGRYDRLCVMHCQGNADRLPLSVCGAHAGGCPGEYPRYGRPARSHPLRPAGKAER